MEANNNVQEQGAIPPNMPTNYTVEAAEILTLKYNVPFPDHADGMGSVQELKPLKPNVFVSAVGDKIRTNVNANTYAMYLIGKAIHSRRMGRDNTHPVQHLRTAVRRLNAMPAGTRQRANTRTGEDPHIYHILTVEVNRLKALYNRNGDSVAGREVKTLSVILKGYNLTESDTDPNTGVVTITERPFNPEIKRIMRDYLKKRVGYTPSKGRTEIAHAHEAIVGYHVVVTAGAGPTRGPWLFVAISLLNEGLVASGLPAIPLGPNSRDDQLHFHQRRLDNSNEVVYEYPTPGIPRCYFIDSRDEVHTAALTWLNSNKELPTDPDITPRVESTLPSLPGEAEGNPPGFTLF
jgi:hypothetical protein